MRTAEPALEMISTDWRSSLTWAIRGNRFLRASDAEMAMGAYRTISRTTIAPLGQDQVCQVDLAGPASTWRDRGRLSELCGDAERTHNTVSGGCGREPRGPEPGRRAAAIRV